MAENLCWAKQQLEQGKKVRKVHWDKGTYIQAKHSNNENNPIIFHDGSSYRGFHLNPILPGGSYGDDDTGDYDKDFLDQFGPSNVWELAE